MGALTTAYSIPPDVMEKLRANKKLLQKLFQAEPGWKFDDHCFDKGWDEKIRIIGHRFPRTRNRLDHQKLWKYPDHDVWIVPPKDVQFAANEIAGETLESLKKGVLVMRDGKRERDLARDQDGEPIPEHLYEYYVGDIERFRAFLLKAANDGNYLLFATG